MNTIDRRGMMRAILGGAAVATLGATVATVGVVATSSTIEAAPIALDKTLSDKVNDLVLEAQAVVVGPRRRRRRRWVCWWRRGRRVCGWRW
jgi:hypothetical protein